MKTCFKCSQEKQFLEFYKHSGMSDGFSGKCKSCTKKDVHENREKRKDYYDQKDRDRAPLKYERKAQYQKDRKDIRIAHRLVYKAIKEGLLIKISCEKCGDNNSHAHHENYSKPLDVVWLCQKHHRRRHSELIELGIDVYATVPV